jgi:hypothetical protein
MERRRWAARSNVKSHMGAILCAGPQEQETVLRHFRASQRRALRDALVAGTIAAATVGAAPRLLGLTLSLRRRKSANITRLRRRLRPRWQALKTSPIDDPCTRAFFWNAGRQLRRRFVPNINRMRKTCGQQHVLPILSGLANRVGAAVPTWAGRARMNKVADLPYRTSISAANCP